MEKMKMNESEKDIAKLKAENDALKDRLAKLEEQVNPPPRKQSYSAPYDYTAGATMPASALRAMINAVPDALMNELRGDARRPNPVNPPTQSQPTTQVQRGSGWRDEVPISSPPGIAICDRMVDAQDQLDRAELAMKLAKAEMLKK
jgi:hypothetical protein